MDGPSSPSPHAAGGGGSTAGIAAAGDDGRRGRRRRRSLSLSRRPSSSSSRRDGSTPPATPPRFHQQRPSTPGQVPVFTIRTVPKATSFTPVAKENDLKIEEATDPFFGFEDLITTERLQQLSGFKDLAKVTTLSMSVDTTEQSMSAVGELCPNLVQLKLNDSVLTSIRDLGTSLRNLRVLWISRCGIKDLDGFSVLDNLKELYLSFNLVSDVSPLSLHEQLEVLDAEGNDISDVDQLDSLGTCLALRALTLEANPITTRPHYRRLVYHHISHLELLDDEDLVEDDKVPMTAEDLEEAAKPLPSIDEEDDEWGFGLEENAVVAKSLRSRAEDRHSSPAGTPIKSPISRSHFGSPSPPRPRTALSPKRAPLEEQWKQFKAAAALVEGQSDSIFSPSSRRMMLKLGNSDSALQSGSSSLTHGSGVVFAGNPVLAIRRRRGHSAVADSDEMTVTDVLDRTKALGDASREDVLAEMKSWDLNAAVAALKANPARRAALAQQRPGTSAGVTGTTRKPLSSSRWDSASSAAIKSLSSAGSSTADAASGSSAKGANATPISRQSSPSGGVGASAESGATVAAQDPGHKLWSSAETRDQLAQHFASPLAARPSPGGPARRPQTAAPAAFGRSTAPSFIDRLSLASTGRRSKGPSDSAASSSAPVAPSPSGGSESDSVAVHDGASRSGVGRYRNPEPSPVTNPSRPPLWAEASPARAADAAIGEPCASPRGLSGNRTPPRRGIAGHVSALMPDFGEGEGPPSSPQPETNSASSSSPDGSFSGRRGSRRPEPAESRVLGGNPSTPPRSWGPSKTDMSGSPTPAFVVQPTVSPVPTDPRHRPQHQQQAEVLVLDGDFAASNMPASFSPMADPPGEAGRSGDATSKAHDPLGPTARLDPGSSAARRKPLKPKHISGRPPLATSTSAVPGAGPAWVGGPVTPGSASSFVDGAFSFGGSRETGTPPSTGGSFQDGPSVPSTSCPGESGGESRLASGDGPGGLSARASSPSYGHRLSSAGSIGSAYNSRLSFSSRRSSDADSSGLETDGDGDGDGDRNVDGEGNADPDAEGKSTMSSVRGSSSRRRSSKSRSTRSRSKRRAERAERAGSAASSQQPQLQASSASSSSSGSVGDAVAMGDTELVELLRQRPKHVPALRSRENFRRFFRGISQERMARLLQTAYDSLEAADRDSKVRKRLVLLDGLMT